MDFHIEKLDEEQLKKYHKLIEPHQYILSMSRNVVSNDDGTVLLFCLGGQGYAPEERRGPPYYYCLVFNDVVIPFYGRDAVSRSNDSFLCTYTLGGVLIPEGMRDFKHQIYSLMTEVIAIVHRDVWKNDSDVVVNISDPKYI